MTLSMQPSKIVKETNTTASVIQVTLSAYLLVHRFHSNRMVKHQKGLHYASQVILLSQR